MDNILEPNEKDFSLFAASVNGKQLPKPSLLYIFTGLGRYSWYKIPFIKGVLCVSIPAYIISCLCVLFRFRRGKCHCREGVSCFYICILGFTIGLCKKGKVKLNINAIWARV